MLIYPLLQTRDGRQQAEFPVGSLSWDSSSGVVLDCPDREVFRRLHRHFSFPLTVRRPRGASTSVLAHEWEELSPGTEEHFREAVARLHHLGVVACPT